MSWRHPVGSRPWLREAGLGVAIGVLLVQVMGGTGMGLLFRGLVVSSGEHIRQVTDIHHVLGHAILLFLPILYLGHPQRANPAGGQEDSANCHDEDPTIRGFGMLAAVGLGLTLFTGLTIRHGGRLGLPVPGVMHGWHGYAALGFSGVMALHILLAWRKRTRRWVVRRSQEHPRPPRFRGGWWPWTILVGLGGLVVYMAPLFSSVP